MFLIRVEELQLSIEINRNNTEFIIFTTKFLLKMGTEFLLRNLTQYFECSHNILTDITLYNKTLLHVILGILFVLGFVATGAVYYIYHLNKKLKIIIIHYQSVFNAPNGYSNGNSNHITRKRIQNESSFLNVSKIDLSKVVVNLTSKQKQNTCNNSTTHTRKNE